jgi:hypothetical protein
MCFNYKITPYESYEGLELSIDTFERLLHDFSDNSKQKIVDHMIYIENKFITNKYDTNIWLKRHFIKICLKRPHDLSIVNI